MITAKFMELVNWKFIINIGKFIFTLTGIAIVTLLIVGLNRGFELEFILKVGVAGIVNIMALYIFEFFTNHIGVRMPPKQGGNE